MTKAELIQAVKEENPALKVSDIVKMSKIELGALLKGEEVLQQAEKVVVKKQVEQDECNGCRFLGNLNQCRPCIHFNK